MGLTDISANPTAMLKAYTYLAYSFCCGRKQVFYWLNQDNKILVVRSLHQKELNNNFPLQVMVAMK